MNGAQAPWQRPRCPIELLTPAEMAEADRLATATVAGIDLMERAGSAVAAAALRHLAGDGRAVVVLCGPGNNGGDGYVAARRLAEAGCRVSVAALGERTGLSGDAAIAASAWDGPVLRLSDAPIETAALVIDALFGAGLARDLDGLARDAVARINAARARGCVVVAVDVPTGLDGASGTVRGLAVEATETVTFFRLKPGHVLLPGRTLCGHIALADIGLPADVLAQIAPAAALNVPALWARAFRVPTLTGHKYARGHAIVMSGPATQTGAARLCARGALRAGAGLVTVATPAEALAIHAVALTAIMTRVVDDAAMLAELLADPRKNALVLGPGLGVGEPTCRLVRAALAPGPSDTAPRSIVLDADALSSFADAPQNLFEAIAASRQAVVLTPHDGEFSKLFGNVLDVFAPKPERARKAAATSDAIVLLKGPDSVVADPDGRTAIAASDAPWLATAGSGDVLAGMICGLLAQHMPAFEACAAAVWLHAEAARRFGPGLIAEDIPDLLPGVLSDLLRSGAISSS